MSKLWTNPKLVHLGLEPGGDDVVTGEGTGQSGDEIWACSFEDWLIMFSDDYDGNTEIDFDDYRKWWKDNEFGEDLWSEFNPKDPLNP